MAGTLARRSTMEKLVIEGGVPLSGTIVPAGNKNAALPLLAASLLTEERVVIANVPRIRDTEAMLALLADLGVHRRVDRGQHGLAAGRRDRRTPTSIPTWPSASAPPSSSPARCWRASAPRRCRRRAAT